MTNDERWDIFISELKAYIQEHQKCPPKHCTLYNAQKYYRRKMKEGTLDEEKSRELECVLGLRDLSLHTGRAESLKIGAVDSASSPTKCLEIVVPSDEFNVVYLLSHIYRHLLGLGIGLLQLMDYYFALRAVSGGSKVSEGFKVSEVSKFQRFQVL